MKKIIVILLALVLMLSLLLTYEKLTKGSQYERVMGSFLSAYIRDKQSGGQLIDGLALYYPIKEEKTIAYLGDENWIGYNFSSVGEDLRVLYDGEDVIENNLYCHLGDISTLSQIDELTYYCQIAQKAVYDGEGNFVRNLKANDFFEAYDAFYNGLFQLSIKDENTLEFSLAKPITYLSELLNEHFGPIRVENEYNGNCYLKKSDEEETVLVNIESGKTISFLKLDNRSAYELFESGELDFMKLEPVSYLKAKQDGLAVVERQEYIVNDYLFFNMHNELSLETRQLLLALLNGEKVEPENELVIGVKWAENSRFKDKLTELVAINSNQKVQLLDAEDGELFEQYLTIDDYGIDILFYDLFLPRGVLSDLMGFSYEKE